MSYAAAMYESARQDYADGEHKFSSTQFDLSDAGYARSQGNPVSDIRKIAASIADEDLAADGREETFHVTIKYGLHTGNADEVREIVAGFGPIEITVGKVSMFPANACSEVVFSPAEGEKTKIDICETAKSVYAAEMQASWRRQQPVCYAAEMLRAYAGEDKDGHLHGEAGLFATKGNGKANGAGNGKPPESPAAPGHDGQIARKQKLINHFAEAGSKVLSGASQVEHGVKVGIEAAVAKLPKALQAVVAGVYQAAFSTYLAAQSAVKAVAQERGLSSEQIGAVAKGVAIADMIGGAKLFPMALAAAGMGAEGVMAGGFVPVGSLGYLAYSSARNPAATLRAARKAISSALAKPEPAQVYGAEGYDFDLIGELADRGAHLGKDFDVWLACYLAACDESGNLQGSLEVADRAAPEALAADDDADLFEDAEGADLEGPDLDSAVPSDHAANGAQEHYAGDSGETPADAPGAASSVATTGPRTLATHHQHLARAFNAGIDRLHRQVRTGELHPDQAQEQAQGHLDKMHQATKTYAGRAMRDVEQRAITEHGDSPATQSLVDQVRQRLKDAHARTHETLAERAQHPARDAGREHREGGRLDVQGALESLAREPESGRRFIADSIQGQQRHLEMLDAQRLGDRLNRKITASRQLSPKDSADLEAHGSSGSYWQLASHGPGGTLGVTSADMQARGETHLPIAGGWAVHHRELSAPEGEWRQGFRPEQMAQETEVERYAVDPAREASIAKLSQAYDDDRRGVKRMPEAASFAKFPATPDQMEHIQASVHALTRDKYSAPTLGEVYGEAARRLGDLKPEQFHGTLARLHHEGKVRLEPHTRAVSEIEQPEHTLPLGGELMNHVRPVAPAPYAREMYARWQAATGRISYAALMQYAFDESKVDRAKDGRFGTVAGTHVGSSKTGSESRSGHAHTHADKPISDAEISAATSASAKYPRTPHVPGSPGGTRDDRRLQSLEHFVGKEIVLTEKVDGSNMRMTREALTARSQSGSPRHPSFDLAKAVHAQVKNNIPEGVAVFGEYVYAKHSIEYDNLPGYFMVFGAQDTKTGKWWDWDSVGMLSEEVGLPTVPVLFRGKVDSEAELASLVKTHGDAGSVLGKQREGVVLRLADGYDDLSKGVAKWVRSDHVQSDEHWTAKRVEKNKVAPAKPKNAGAADHYAKVFDESKVHRGQPENAGQFGPGGGGKPSKTQKPAKGSKAAPPEQSPRNEKAQRAKDSAKRVDASIQRYAEEYNEPRFAKVVDGQSLPDGEPADVITKNGDGIEMKTMTSNGNDKLTMDSYSQVRKINWEKENKSTFHTVVSDDRKVFNANGEGQHGDNSDRVYYYRRGVAGSARIGTMHRCKDEAELKQLMTTPEKDLPEGAQRTDGKLRVGKWKAFHDEDGKGFKNLKTGQIVRAKK